MKHVLALILIPLAWLAGSVHAAETVTIKVNAAQTRADINPFIYGQFIEHLGRCIYGGIWAEMLEDRKFYFPVTQDYAPYKSLQDTDYPVVGASPWKIVGAADGVAMDSEDPFVGDHTPRVKPGSGVQQLDLALVKGKEYIGYVWAKGAGTVKVQVHAPSQQAIDLTSAQASDEYKKHEFRFTAPASTDKATLSLRVSGGGSVHIGTASLMPADNVQGMRPDTLALLKKLNAPIYRWPGGNFVSGYDWRDGIGPRDKRPPRRNPAWTGVEHNDVGIDEFIAFCRAVDAEPMIAANTGFGDAYSAAQEVEYCNGSTDTIGGSWRAKSGHQEPFNVKYWCVGNEMFGDWQLGYMKLEHYGLKHNRFARAMSKADPSLVLVGVGDLGAQNSGGETGWTQGMLKSSADHMDMISEHFYVGRVPWNQQGPRETVAEHVDDMRIAIRRKAEGHRKLQDKMGLTGDKRIPIAMDEWNYWHRKYAYGELGCRYDLADALGVAVGLHEYFRASDIIHMAHYAQTVNVIGCIKTTKTDAFFSTTALPLMLYREHFGVQPVAVEVTAGEERLDVVAALTEDGSALTISVVNPHPEPIAVDLNLEGFAPESTATVWQVRGDDPKATNDEHNTRVEAKKYEGVEFKENPTAPPYSFTIVRLPRAE